MAIGTATGRTLVTYDDYLEIPNDGKRYEILDGVIFVSPAPSRHHQRAVGGFHQILRPHVLQHRLGEVMVSPLDIKLDNFNVVQPDIVYISRARRAIAKDNVIDGPPDLVIEVLSPSTMRHDQVAKRQIYERFGVPHYWQAHPIEQWVRAYALSGGEYELVAEAQGDETFSAPPFPDLPIILAELWYDPLADDVP